jgi:hypothetical protein
MCISSDTRIKLLLNNNNNLDTLHQQQPQPLSGNQALNTDSKSFYFHLLPYKNSHHLSLLIFPLLLSLPT